MKKILILLSVLIMCVSCVYTYRTDDYFVICSKEMSGEKYRYGINQYVKNNNGYYYFCDFYYIISNDNYELGETIRLVKTNN